MHFWLVRILLNLAALVAAGAVGAAGMTVTGSPLSFVFSVLIYFFLAWGLAVQATQGPAHVSLRAYIRPLLLTFWPLGAVVVVFMLAGQAASEIDPENPDLAAGLQSVPTLLNLVIIVVFGFVISLVMVIPAVVAIIDRPPPIDPFAERSPAIIAQPAGQSIDTPAPTIQLGSLQAAPMPAAVTPDPARSNTLEELFGLEPGRES